MRVRARVSFAGAFSMYRGEERECGDSAVLQDLLKAGYIEEVNQKAATKKGGKKNESKRNNK